MKITEKNKTKKKLISAVLALVMACTMSFSVFAEGTDAGTAADPATNFDNNSQSTEVFLKAGDAAKGNLSATVPVKVVLAVKADKDVVAPANTDYKIANTGALAFHVSVISTTLESGYTFSTNADTAKSTSNALYLTLAAGGDILTLAPGNVALGTATKWNVAAGADLGLTLAGSVGKIKADLTTETKVFTITYTIAAGTVTA